MTRRTFSMTSHENRWTALSAWKPANASIMSNPLTTLLTGIDYTSTITVPIFSNNGNHIFQLDTIYKKCVIRTDALYGEFYIYKGATKVCVHVLANAKNSTQTDLTVVFTTYRVQRPQTRWAQEYNFAANLARVSDLSFFERSSTLFNNLLTLTEVPCAVGSAAYEQAETINAGTTSSWSDWSEVLTRRNLS